MPRGDRVKQLVRTRKEGPPVRRSVFATPSSPCFPTGITLLNLAASGRADGGFAEGTIVHTVGDSETMKSLMGLTVLAEASLQSRYRKHALVKDDAENSDHFDVGAMFGESLATRLRAPRLVAGQEQHSFYIEDFYDGIYRRVRAGEPFVYVLDSADALETHASIEKYEANAKARAADKASDVKGSFGDGKAKAHSENLRKVKSQLVGTRSLLFIISQTRDNINPMSMDSKTHAGGKALKFYSQYQIWLAPYSKLSMTVNGTKKQNGNLVMLRLSKNQVTGKHIDFLVPVYYGWGIDDEQCSLRWLKSEKLWDVKEGKLTTRGECGLDKQYKVSTFVELVRDGTLRQPFQQAMQQAWDEVETKVRRPGRYSGGSCAVSGIEEGE